MKLIADDTSSYNRPLVKHKKFTERTCQTTWSSPVLQTRFHAFDEADARREATYRVHVVRWEDGGWVGAGWIVTLSVWEHKILQYELRDVALRKIEFQLNTWHCHLTNYKTSSLTYSRLWRDTRELHGGRKVFFLGVGEGKSGFLQLVAKNSFLGEATVMKLKFAFYQLKTKRKTFFH